MEIFWTHSDQFHDRSYSLRAEITYNCDNFDGMFEGMVHDEGKELKPATLRIFRAFISRRKSEEEMYYLSIHLFGGQAIKCYFYTLEGAREMAEKVLINFVNNMHKVEVSVNPEPLKLRTPEEEYLRYT